MSISNTRVLVSMIVDKVPAVFGSLLLLACCVPCLWGVREGLRHPLGEAVGIVLGTLMAGVLFSAFAVGWWREFLDGFSRQKERLEWRADAAQRRKQKEIEDHEKKGRVRLSEPGELDGAITSVRGVSALTEVSSTGNGGRDEHDACRVPS